MVSLQPSRFTMSRSAQFMDDVLIDSTPTVSHLINNDTTPILTSSGDASFKKLKTIPLFGIHLFSSVIICTVSVAFVVRLPDNKDSHYVCLISLRAVYWLITLIFDHFVRQQHHNLRVNGYHEFHQRITLHNGIPLMVVSAWNTIILLVQALFNFYNDMKRWHIWVTPVSSLAVLNITEMFILVLLHGWYMLKVCDFNRKAQLPDALRGSNHTEGSLGLVQPQGNTAELLEKQADLIAYLKDHNLKLNEKLHQMQLNTRSSHLGH